MNLGARDRFFPCIPERSLLSMLLNFLLLVQSLSPVKSLPSESFLVRPTGDLPRPLQYSEVRYQLRSARLRKRCPG